MFASHRRARASALLAVVLSLGGLSCARGVQGAGPSVEDAATSVSSPGDVDAGAASPSYGSYGSLDDAAGVDPGAADDTGDDASLGAGDDGDDALESVGDDAGDDPPDVLAPVPGELAITEVMLSPSGPEPRSEWFEIYNLATSARLLSGITIEDGYGDTQVIESTGPIVVPPLSYVVLVRDEAAAVQTLVPASSIVYAYGAGLSPIEGIELDDGADGDLSLWSGSTLLADVPYGMWDSAWTGQSIELAAPGADASDPARWCVAQSPWASGSDDGTPGAASDCGP